MNHTNLKQCKKNTMSSSKHQLTAIIYDRRGRVLSIGKNSYTKTHTQMLIHGRKVGITNRPYLHAEMDAIIKCRSLNKAYKMSVFRYGNDGRPLLAKPCPICWSAIQSIPSIKIVEWTTPQ